MTTEAENAPPPDCRRIVIRLCYGIKTAPPGHEPYQHSAPNRCSPVSCSVTRKSCRPPSRSARTQEWAGGTGHLLHLWSVATRQAWTRHRRANQGQAHRLRSLAVRTRALRNVLQQRLRAVQFAGHDITAIIGQITAAPMNRARSIASVLHGRLQRLALPQLAGHDVTLA
jgi:hypothetical protein